jgi:hypothetical protein
MLDDVIDAGINSLLVNERLRGLRAIECAEGQKHVTVQDLDADASCAGQRRQSVLLHRVD